jgi:hypothetical protein
MHTPCLRDLLVGTMLAASLLAGCAPPEEETNFLARKAVLLRQNQGLRELIAAADSGTLVPADRFLVGIDERVVAEILNSQLPMDRPLGKRFMIHLDRATVLFRDKYGLVTLEGDIHPRTAPHRRTSVRILGGLGAVRIDPGTGLLDADIAIDQVEVLEAGRFENVLGRSGKKLLSKQGRPMLQEALPTLHVPVALAQKIRIPAIQEGPVRLDSLTIPLRMSVEGVLAAGHKLWVYLDAEVGAVTGAEEGLGVVVQKKPHKAGGGK